MRKLGYARVSTEEQNLDMQLDALNRLGCDRIYTEKVSGKKTDNRPQLAKMLSDAKEGDMIVVFKIDRLSRSLRDLVTIIEDLEKRGLNFKSINESIDTSTPMGKAMYQMIGIFAELERANIALRTRAGLKSGRGQGRFGGAPKGIRDLGRAALIKELIKDETLSVAEICRRVKVTKPTFYKYLNSTLDGRNPPIDLGNYAYTKRPYHKKEILTFALKTYFEAVADGGHRKFFSEPSFVVWQDALEGLTQVDWIEHRAVLEKVVEYLERPYKAIPKTDVKLNNAMAEFDQEFFKLKSHKDKIITLTTWEKNQKRGPKGIFKKED